MAQTLYQMTRFARVLDATRIPPVVRGSAVRIETVLRITSARTHRLKRCDRGDGGLKWTPNLGVRPGKALPMESGRPHEAEWGAQVANNNGVLTGKR